MIATFRTFDGSVHVPLVKQADGSLAANLRAPAPAAAPAPARTKPATVAFQGAHLWAAWHRRALVWDAGDDMAWIRREILAKLPTCSCGNHVQAYLAAHPPTWGDYFTWTVDLHNEVNRRLGKPQVGVHEARSIWSPLPLPGPH